LGGADHPALLVEADGIFRRLGIATGFYFDEYEDVTIPRDDVDFPALNAISGAYDSIAQTAEISDGLDFRIAAEWEEPA
jgi:hypothetical protein